MAELAAEELPTFMEYPGGGVFLDANTHANKPPFKRYGTGEPFKICVMAPNPKWPEPLTRDEERLSDQLYGWLPPEALTEHIERLSQQIAALMPLPRKGLDKTYRTSWQDSAVEKLDLEEHTFAEQQKAISTNRVLGDNLDGNGNQIVTERQAVRHSPLIRYSTESLLKLCQSPLICWPDGLPKDKKWMGKRNDSEHENFIQPINGAVPRQIRQPRHPHPKYAKPAPGKLDCKRREPDSQRSWNLQPQSQKFSSAQQGSWKSPHATPKNLDSQRDKKQQDLRQNSWRISRD